MRKTDALIERLVSEYDVLQGPKGRFSRLAREYLWPVKGLITVALLMNVIWSAVPYGHALTWRFLIDSVLLVGSGGIPPDAVDSQLRLALVFFGLTMALWTAWLLTQWLRSYCILNADRRVVFRLREDLHKKLQRLNIGFYERTHTGRILSRVLDDVNVIHRWITTHSLNLSTHVVRLAIGIPLLFYLNASLAKLSLLALLIYTWIFTRLRPRVHKASIASRRLNSLMYARATERISGIKVVQAFHREKNEMSAFARLANNFMRVGMKIVRYEQSLELSAGAVTAVITGAIIYLGARDIQGGLWTVGSFAVFLSSLSHLFQSVNSLSTPVTQLQAVSVVIGRLFALLDEEAQVQPGSIRLTGMTGKLRFEDVSFTYPGQKTPALSRVDFKIKAGERVALMGPSGAGKSTVFQLLMRFYDPDHGVISVGGVNLCDADPASVRRHVCMVQQEPFVFAGSIGEAISFGRLDASPKQIMRAAAMAELEDFIMSLPLKYETAIGERGVTISGGQKQRLALATALLTEPEVLLLDDTTSALDPSTESRIRATLKKVLEGRTSLIITQRIATARDCDRIIVLSNGRIAQTGTHEELAAQDGFYRRACVEQSALPSAPNAVIMPA